MSKVNIQEPSVQQCRAIQVEPLGNQPIHIVSFVVHIQRQFMPALRDAYRQDARVEIRPYQEDGKCLFLVEVNNENEIREFMDELTGFPDVVSATLVYHHVETESALREALQ